MALTPAAKSFMITVLFSGLLGSLLAFKIFRPEDTIEWALSIILALCFFVGGAGFGVVVAYMLPAQLETKTEIQKLIALQDGSSIKGSFFLGTGTVEGQMRYAYYSEVAKGQYKLQTVPTDRTLISYSDQTPTIAITAEQPTDSWINWFAYDETIENYIFYVPQNSILQNFNLDAK